MITAQRGARRGRTCGEVCVLRQSRKCERMQQQREARGRQKLHGAALKVSVCVWEIPNDLFKFHRRQWECFQVTKTEEQSDVIVV